jgi:endonuclease/exonuclease/phosphatase family metal-dependent hydrolase
LFTTPLLLTLSTLVMHSRAALPIRLLTHNIRYATTDPFEGEKPWADRRPLMINEFKYNTLYNAESFICLQEVLNNQITDIMTGLGPDWTYIGVGRDDGKKAGEYSPLIFRKAIWDVESWKTVWLNEDGSVGKKGWDAGSVRIVTMGHFRHVESKKRVLGMCTHFDNSGAVSRRESAKIIEKLIAVEAKVNGTSIPYFLGGDLNSETTDDAYMILNSGNSTVQDTKELAGWKYGDEYTFTGFDEEKTLIDFVFLGPRGGRDWDVVGYSVLPNRFDDGVYYSDHRAVVVDTVLNV